MLLSLMTQTLLIARDTTLRDTAVTLKYFSSRIFSLYQLESFPRWGKVPVSFSPSKTSCH